MPHPIIENLAPVAALRRLSPGETPRVSNMELFFDLVYVFAIIQLSHFLLAHETWLGAFEGLILFAAVWWAWNYTAWATNWLDTNHHRGRMLMAVLMACALLMAAAMPEAYGDRALLFAGAYVAMALIRAGYMACLFRGQAMGRNYGQLFAWGVVSGLFWIAGALLPEQRLALWLIAVLIDYIAPYLGFWLPGRGATDMTSWPLRGLHLLERNQQIFIIALGESILLIGGLLVQNELGFDVLLATMIGFALIVSLWWIYFVHLTEIGEHRFEHATDHAQLARAGLAYAHGLMICGTIVMAVAIELIVAHPHGHVSMPMALIAFFGPTIFLTGSAVFHHIMAERMPLSYLAAILALALWCWIALRLNGEWLGAGILAVMVTLVALSHRKGGAK
ncbi:low temperature requirement protein A [Szabonella alba]|uniref:Low temperature requirement protein A n=1 Tax=Szabonella alba TaxID=2804194 RepID=A0A8K0VGZ3_9RHOB|nr:low temperature requirement protein A [Szabonella alba]MBL4918895.1 low temperature requirement protein A [Szabonella alba]